MSAQNHFVVTWPGRVLETTRWIIGCYLVPNLSEERQKTCDRGWDALCGIWKPFNTQDFSSRDLSLNDKQQGLQGGRKGSFQIMLDHFRSPLMDVADAQIISEGSEDLNSLPWVLAEYVKHIQPRLLEGAFVYASWASSFETKKSCTGNDTYCGTWLWHSWGPAEAWLWLFLRRLLSHIDQRPNSPGIRWLCQSKISFSQAPSSLAALWVSHQRLIAWANEQPKNALSRGRRGRHSSSSWGALPRTSSLTSWLSWEWLLRRYKIWWPQRRGETQISTNFLKSPLFKGSGAALRTLPNACSTLLFVSSSEPSQPVLCPSRVCDDLFCRAARQSCLSLCRGGPGWRTLTETRLKDCETWCSLSSAFSEHHRASWTSLQSPALESRWCDPPSGSSPPSLIAVIHCNVGDVGVR